MKFKLFTLLFTSISLIAFNHQARAEFSTGLTINAAEVGIGKFHRKDNTIHPYLEGNAWKAFILAADSNSNPKSNATPIIQENSDGSVTVFFSTLDELISSVEKISLTRHKLISNLNINGHGLPGTMWFPKDEKTKNSMECLQWRETAAAEDSVNYDQYYSPVPKEEIQQIRKASNATGFLMPCTTGLQEWKSVLTNHPGFKATLASNIQIHLLSCVVGLGSVGDRFTQGLASLLLTTDSGRVQTSIMFGLGDWSMAEGMGFWDYQNDAQLQKDNENYPIHRSDREEMQKGSIRVAGLLNNKITSSLLENQDFMFMDDRMPGVLSFKSQPNIFRSQSTMDINTASANQEMLKIHSLRVPGTRSYVNLVR